MEISPAFNGFIKGILLVVVLSATSYVADAGNLTGWLNIGTATIVAGIASAIESYIKEKTGRGSFGAVRIS